MPNSEILHIKDLRKYSLSSDNDEKDRLLPRNKFKLRICWEAVYPSKVTSAFWNPTETPNLTCSVLNSFLLSLRIYSYLHSRCLREWKHLSPSLPNQEYGTDILLFLSLHWHTKSFKAIHLSSLLFYFSSVPLSLSSSDNHPCSNTHHFSPNFWNSLITCNP